MRDTITISLPRQWREIVDQLAKERETSRSDVVREAVREYVFRIEFERLRRIGVAAAQEKGIFTDEDVFEIVS